MIHQDISPESIKQHLLAKIPDNLKNAFERVIVAGMKLFYSKDMQAKVMDGADSGQPLAAEIGVTAMGAISILQAKSNNTIPPQVLIPAGIYLIVEASDFMEKSGKFPDITDQVIGDAIEIFIVALLKKNGITGEQAQQMAQQISGQVEGGSDVAVPTTAKQKAGLLQQGAQ